MAHYRKMLHFHTEEPRQIINITPQVRQAVAESGIAQGLALVYPMHTSSAVYISDSDFSLTHDFDDLLAELVPETRQYRHNETDYKQNATGHLSAILAGHSVTIPVTDADLDLGTYQTLYYFEFDGRRPKEVVVKLLGEA